MATSLEGMILEVQLAAGTLETMYWCSSSEDLMMALSYLWMNGHNHCFSRTCTFVHTHAHQRRPNPNMCPGTSQQPFKNPVFKQA